MKPQRNARGAKARADRYFSLIIRSRGRCERCGESDYAKLQCAHIVGRRFNATRCDEQNAMCLCAKCHLWLTGEPYEHVVFCTRLLGEDVYAAVRARAVAGEKVDWTVKAIELRDRWNQIEAGEA